MKDRMDPRAGLLRPPRQRSRSILGAVGLTMGTLGLAVAGGVFLGGGVTAQTAPPPPPRPIAPLKTVAVPEPPNLGDFVRDKTAAIQLGKALFWDPQVGSDGVTACATCHFAAGADSRTKNSVSPGLNATPRDTTFQIGGGPNYTLLASDFPTHTNDVVSSQGVFRRDFDDSKEETGPKNIDPCTWVADPDGFSVGGINTRRVEPRNAPTMINAVFNFRNFWDGRAQNHFNGVNPFGDRDPDARVLKLVNGKLQQVQVSIPNASLASQAVGPPRSKFEMSCDGRAFEEIGEKLLRRGDRPLAKQHVDPKDSVLGRLADDDKGLDTTYRELIKRAFRPEWWGHEATDLTVTAAELDRDVTVGTEDVDKVRKPPARKHIDHQFSQMESNFSLYFGLAVQLYEATLVANDTPVDRYLAGDTTALSADAQAGLGLFSSQFGSGKAKCDACHSGPELTGAAVSNTTNERLERMHMGNGGIAVYDNGFYNTGVRPTTDDLGLGGKDAFGNPLAEVAFCVLNGGANCPIKNQDANGQLQNSSIANPIGPRPLENIPEAPLDPTERINVDGTFKTPGLRNVELTGPYMHNGGLATLRQVVDFYNRGGDFAQANQANLDPNIEPLGLTDTEENQLVAFMMALTDDRVRYERAPFDHPQLCVPNGHPGDTTHVTTDKPANPGQATDQTRCIPATGAGGTKKGLQTFTSALGLKQTDK
jgi:cytochrome c peroxidase